MKQKNTIKDTDSILKNVFNRIHISLINLDFLADDNVVFLRILCCRTNCQSNEYFSDVAVNTTYTEGSIRLFCWIMTSPQNLQKRAKYVKMTWVQRCDRYVFISSESNYGFPTVGVPTFEGRKHLTEKTMLGFEYIYNKHFYDADWFLKVDDDAYVIVENLRYFLSTQNPEEPIYFGHHFNAMAKQGYFSGGSGFVLSKEALRRFGQHGNESNRCRNQHGVGGDAKFGVCMQHLGVRTGNSLDKYGRNRFHCFNPETHLKGDYPSWYYRYDANGAKAVRSLLYNSQPIKTQFAKYLLNNSGFRSHVYRF